MNALRYPGVAIEAMKLLVITILSSKKEGDT